MTKSAPFIGLAETLEKVRATPSKNQKVEILSVYLKGLGPDDAELAARVASGRSSERGSKDEAQVGYSTLLEVIREITGAAQQDVSRAYLRHGDLGEVAQELLAEKKEVSLFDEPLSLIDIGEAFEKLRGMKGP